jgi:hypothetical protein
MAASDPQSPDLRPARADTYGTRHKAAQIGDGRNTVMSGGNGDDNQHICFIGRAE